MAEVQNNITVRLLVLKEFVNKLAIQGNGNMTVDLIIFLNLWCLTDKAMFFSLVAGRDIN